MNTVYSSGKTFNAQLYRICHLLKIDYYNIFDYIKPFKYISENLASNVETENRVFPWLQSWDNGNCDNLDKMDSLFFVGKIAKLKT